MDLYISPMSCSLAAYIACLEAGVTPTVHPVDRKTKAYDDGLDYFAIAPKGIVPAITLPEGGILTETAAVLQYIADHAPETQLAPPAGTLDRYRLIEWLNFTTSELHKKHLWTVFSSKTSPEHKAWGRATAPATLAPIERHLSGREYLVGERYTIADIYMFWALLAAPHGGISLDAFPALVAYVARIQGRPAVAAALAHDYPLYLREVNAPAA